MTFTQLCVGSFWRSGVVVFSEGLGGSSLLTTVFFFKLNACKVLYFWPLWHFSPSAHQPESFSLIAWLAKSNRSVAIYWDRKLLQSMNELNTILKQKLNYWFLIEITLLMSQFYILTILMTYLDPLKTRRYCKVIKIYTFFIYLICFFYPCCKIFAQHLNHLKCMTYTQQREKHATGLRLCHLYLYL